MNKIHPENFDHHFSSGLTMRPMALYLCVHDRQRAESFYKKLFRTAAVMTSDPFTFFDLNGFIFGLFAPDNEYERLQFCQTTAPQLRVKVPEVAVEFLKIRALEVKIIQPLQRSADRQFFQFLDSEGNTVEFYG